MKLKTFPSDTLVLVPDKWCQALGMERHHQQAHLLVIAEHKSQAERMLAANTTQGQAWHLVRAIKLRRDGLSDPDQALVDAGIVSLSLPGVFAYYSGIRDSPVIQALPDGTCPVVGYFRLETADGPFGRRIYAERAGGEHATSD